MKNTFRPPKSPERYKTLPWATTRHVRGRRRFTGKDPVKGVEFCSVSESMFSLETMLSITETWNMQICSKKSHITHYQLRRPMTLHPAILSGSQSGGTF